MFYNESLVHLEALYLGKLDTRKVSVSILEREREILISFGISL